MSRNRVSLPRLDRAYGAPWPGAGRTTRRLAAGLLASVSLGALTAAAVDATWVGGQQPAPAEWTQGTNWQSTPAHTLPDGTAFFTNNGAVTSLSVTGVVSLGQMQFGAAAPAYNFNIGDGVNESFVALTGGGVVVQSASTPSFAIQRASEMTFLNGSSAGAAVYGNSGTLFFADFSTAAQATISTIGTVDFTAQSSAGTATLFNEQTGAIAFRDSSTAGSARITNTESSSTSFIGSSTAGSAHIVNRDAGTQTVFSETSNAGHATIDNAGHLSFLQNSSAASATITNDLGAATSFQNSSSAGNATIVNHSAVDFKNTSTAGNASISSEGFTRFSDTSTAGTATLSTGAGGFTGFLDRSTGGQARFIVADTGVVDFSASTGRNNDGRLSAGSFEGAGGSIYLGANQLTVGGNNLSTAYAGAISDCGTNGGFECAIPGATGGSLVKAGSGALTLSGINGYSGATDVNAGALIVNGSIAPSVLTTANAGGTLGGNGIVGNTVINGGTLAPGSATGTLTVQGNLSFTAASTYMVEVSPLSAARTNVTGTATLGGAILSANFAPGAYVSRQYTVVNAAGGVTGSFGAQVNTNLPAGFVSSLSYDANSAFLNLKLDLDPPSGQGAGGGNANQRNVAGALGNSFNAAGGIPLVFGALSAAGLTQVSGEAATGAQQTTFNAMSLFIGVLTDPFVAGRATDRRPLAACCPMATANPPRAPVRSARPMA